MEKVEIREAAPNDPRLLAWVMQAADNFIPDFDRVANSLKAGCSRGVFVVSGGFPVAGVVLGLEDDYLIIESAGGHAGFDLTKEVMPIFEEAARDCGLRGVRVDTYRRGMVEKLGALGYSVQFVAMAKNNHG